MKYKMPLLKFADHTLAAKLTPPADWSNTLVIACQHIIESNFLYFQKLIDGSLPSNQVYLLGKSFSTCKEVCLNFENLGVYVHPSSVAFDSHQSFEQQFKQHVSDFFNYIQQHVDLTSFDKVIIVDDGGELIHYANQNITNLNHFSAVEQDASGFHKIKQLELKFPVINIARAEAKLTLEPPIIAETMVNQLQQQLHAQQLNAKSALVIGSGFMGNRLYQQLAYLYDVQRYDIDPNKSDFSEQTLAQILPQFDLIISCAGQQVLTTDDYQYLKDGAILANCAASDSDFSAVALRQKQAKDSNVHAHVEALTKSGNIHLLNAGFPINFDGSWQLIPLHKIQLTVSLVYCGICLAQYKHYPKQLISFDNDIQQALIGEFQRLMTN